MGLFNDTLRGLFSFNTEVKQAVASMVPTWQVGVPQTPLINQRSYEQLTRKGYLGSEIVFACCQAIAKSAASPDMVAYATHDDPGSTSPDLMPSHPSLTVLRRPNPWWTHYQLWASTVVALKINGNAYWERVRDRTGKVIEYWPLRPDRMWVIPDAKSYIRGYEYRLGADTFFLEPSDVIHFKNPHPLNDYYGLAPLAVLIERIDIDVWCREFTTAFFRNAGVPSGLLNIMRSVEPNEREIIRTRFRQQYGGPDGWGNVLVIDNGQATYTKLGMDPGTIGLPEINQITESRICAVMDVPPSIIWTVLGHQSASGLNNSNKQSDQTQWWTGALAPMYEDLAQQYTLASADDWPDVDHFGFDLSQVPGFSKDEDAVHTRVRADFAAGLITWNQAVTLLGYDPDEPGWVVIPSTMIPTPSIQMAHYHEGDQPPGQPQAPAGQLPGASEPGAESAPSDESGGEGGAGGEGGGGGGGGPAGGGSSGGAGETMMRSKLTTDGQFEIVEGCTMDARGEHYRSVTMGVCAWCGEDPYVLKSAEGHEFSSTQLNLPGQLSKELVEWAREHIDTDDLGSEGFETQPHVTVKYGIMPNVGPSDVARALKGQSPVHLTFGSNYVFAGADQGGGVPLYVSVNSDDVSRLNRRLKGALPNIETHSNYTPHVTIAYLKPDAVQKYIGTRSPLYGMHVTLGDLSFSGKNGRVVVIPLASKALSEGIDSAGGYLVNGSGKKPRKRKSQELWDLLDHWRDAFEDGDQDLEAAIKSLEPEPPGVAGWLYKYATGKVATKEVDGEILEYKAGNIDALLDYWRDRFDGGQPGDFDECVSTLNDKVDDPEALCAWLHHEATGYWPGQAPSEKNGKIATNGWEHTVVDNRDDLTKRVQDQVREMERSLLGAGTPVQAYRFGSQTWATLVEGKPEQKFNPYHGEGGRFASADEGGGGGGGESGGGGGTSKGDNSASISKENSTGWLGEHGDSQQLYKPGGTMTPGGYKGGEYTQERLDTVQNPQIAATLDHVQPAEGPVTVYAMGGGPAGGKSSTLDSGAIPVPDQQHAARINADEYKTGRAEKDGAPAIKANPEYAAMHKAGEEKAAAIVHEESSDTATRATHEALTSGKSAVVDAVLNHNADKIQGKVDGWRADGAQRVEASYVTVPPQVAADRAVGRANDPKSDSYGRHVAPEIVQDGHVSVARMFPDLVQRTQAGTMFDKLTLHDTNVPRGTAPRLLLTQNSGEAPTIHDAQGYQDFLARGQQKLSTE